MFIYNIQALNMLTFSVLITYHINTFSSSIYIIECLFDSQISPNSALRNLKYVTNSKKG